MTAYYNEHDAYAAAWLRNLIAAGHIAPGDVDARDIQDVTPDDLTGYTQCHFFAGIGGWSYALRLAGWSDDRPVWTGSCPCQPFSAAGKRAGTDDPRHLWPSWVRLIRECRPVTAIGEQVASAIAHGWLDGVSADLEAEGYTVGAVVLGAHSVGAPHIRQRVWWVAHAEAARLPHRGARPVQPEPREGRGADGGLADAERAERRAVDHARGNERLDGVSPRQEGAGRTRSGGEAGGLGDARHSAQSPLGAISGGTDATEPERGTGGLGDAAPHGRVEERQDTGGRCERSATQGREQRPWDDSELSGLADARRGRDERGLRPRDTSGSARTAESDGDQRQRSGADPWRSSERIPCADGRARRIPQSGIFPLAHGVSGRVGQLRAYGNAICPQVAAVFIRAYRESVTTWR